MDKQRVSKINSCVIEWWVIFFEPEISYQRWWWALEQQLFSDNALVYHGCCKVRGRTIQKLGLEFHEHLLHPFVTHTGMRNLHNQSCEWMTSKCFMLYLVAYEILALCSWPPHHNNLLPLRNKLSCFLVSCTPSAVFAPSVLKWSRDVQHWQCLEESVRRNLTTLRTDAVAKISLFKALNCSHWVRSWIMSCHLMAIKLWEISLVEVNSMEQSLAWVMSLNLGGGMSPVQDSQIYHPLCVPLRVCLLDLCFQDDDVNLQKIPWCGFHSHSSGWRASMP